MAITVDTLVDELDSSIVDGDISLRDAIAVAPAGETIDFAASLDGGAIVLTLGQLNISRPLTIDASALAAGLTIDASGGDPTPNTNNGDGRQLLNVSDGNSSIQIDVELRGLTLTGADTNGKGGGINTQENLTIIDSMITDNSASFGGGIENSGVLAIIGSTVSDNTANFGGGLRSSQNVTIVDSTITGNQATQGGGLNNFGTMTITGSTISLNTATTVSGGGIINGGQLTITDSTISENSSRFGGGIRNGNAGTLSILDSKILKNTATEDGGGIETDGAIAFGGGITITNTVFTGNTAVMDGGAVDNLGDGKITNSSFTGNTANRGGAVRNATSAFTTGVLLIENSILWANVATNAAPEIRDDNGMTTVNYSIVEGGWSGAGANNLDIDPLFVDADGVDDVFGTLDDDLRLMPTSPAIDAGDNTVAGLIGVLTDHDGLPRFVDDAGTPDTGNGVAPIVDLGAFEVQQPVPIAGDMNGDGLVNLGDVAPLIQALVDRSQYDVAYPTVDADIVGDVDGNGTFNLGDIAAFSGLIAASVPIAGDMNGDGLVNLGDVAPFIQALVDRSQYDTAYPTVDADIVGDIDGSGTFDLGDTAAFSGLLTATAAARASSSPSITPSALAADTMFDTEWDKALLAMLDDA